MKKIVTLFVLLSLCVNLCACGNNAANTSHTIPPTEETNGIELTTENIADYLVIKYHYSDKEHIDVGHGLPTLGATAKVTIEIYPIAGGSFNNVKLILTEHISGIWEVDKDDDSYKYIEALTYTEEGMDTKGRLITEIQLPADGMYTETHTIYSPTGIGSLPSDSEKVWYGWDADGVTIFEASAYLPEGTPYVTGVFIPN